MRPEKANRSGKGVQLGEFDSFGMVKYVAVRETAISLVRTKGGGNVSNNMTTKQGPKTSMLRPTNPFSNSPETFFLSI